MRRNTTNHSNNTNHPSTSNNHMNNTPATASTPSNQTEFDDQTMKAIPSTNSSSSSSSSSSGIVVPSAPTVFPTIESLHVPQLRSKIDSMKEEMKNLTNLTNYYRRIYYAESELIIMDIEYILKQKQQYNLTEKEIQLQEILEECLLISKQLKLQYSNKLASKQHLLGYLLYKIDELARGIAVFIFFIYSGFLLTLPCILLFVKWIDIWLVSRGFISPFHQIANNTKAFIAHVFLRIAGIELNVEDLNYDHYGKKCSITCFSHSSTIDAFVISIAIPVTHYTLAKSDLFLIPFFGWHLIAYGGIPIDRSNRDQAIQAIGAAAESAGVGDTVAVSPEGTRSANGQILAFKKGPFHLWESIKAPIVPLMIYGAYDLLPPKNIMSIPGKVYARFLPPIYPNEANSRDEMSYLVRKKMLEAWKDGPKDAGLPLSWRSRLVGHIYVILVYYFTYVLYQYVPRTTYLQYFHLTKTQGFGLGTLFCVGITLMFYIYLMYVKPLLKYVFRKVLGKSASKTSLKVTSGNKQAE